MQIKPETRALGAAVHAHVMRNERVRDLSRIGQEG
jgi:hypothetical protein